MDEKTLIFLGLLVGTGAVIANLYSNDDDYEDCDEEVYRREPYCEPGMAQAPPRRFDNSQVIPPPYVPQEHTSPLDFGVMVENFEQPAEAYEYSLEASGSDGYPYSSLKGGYPGFGDDGNALPVGDMTEMNAAEQNKYIYDRTIGTIGFTSTKIGGRNRGLGDYFRGDLPILPDKNPSFQVSSNPQDKLNLGFINTSNSLGGQGTPTTTVTGAMRAMGGEADLTLDDLRKIKDRDEARAKSGAQRALGSSIARPELTVEQLIRAGQETAKQYNGSSGVYA